MFLSLLNVFSVYFLLVVFREDREARFMASKMSIVASFRSWSGKWCHLQSFLFIQQQSLLFESCGNIFDCAVNHTQCRVRTCAVWLTPPSGPIHLAGIINLCKSGNSGIQSLIGLLCIPNMEVRVGNRNNVTFVCFVKGHNLHPPAKGVELLCKNRHHHASV